MKKYFFLFIVFNVFVFKFLFVFDLILVLWLYNVLYYDENEKVLFLKRKIKIECYIIYNLIINLCILFV